jgi:hypothetical protein
MRFVIRDPKKGTRISEHAPARGGAKQDYQLLHSDASHTICCVSPCPVTRRAGAKTRFAYFLAWYTSGKSLIA